eukprot:GHVS01103219.1.p1 GENE.GHVS01103219.1~~GHVS01103219.1.p1  ORF type:complete len:389 (+),score=108.40 GHVS01103219.1:54-1220(+)
MVTMSPSSFWCSLFHHSLNKQHPPAHLWTVLSSFHLLLLLSALLPSSSSAQPSLRRPSPLLLPTGRSSLLRGGLLTAAPFIGLSSCEGCSVRCNSDTDCPPYHSCVAASGSFLGSGGGTIFADALIDTVLTHQEHADAIKFAATGECASTGLAEASLLNAQDSFSSSGLAPMVRVPRDVLRTSSSLGGPLKMTEAATGAAAMPTADFGIAAVPNEWHPFLAFPDELQKPISFPPQNVVAPSTQTEQRAFHQHPPSAFLQQPPGAFQQHPAALLQPPPFVPHQPSAVLQEPPPALLQQQAAAFLQQQAAAFLQQLPPALLQQPPAFVPQPPSAFLQQPPSALLQQQLEELLQQPPAEVIQEQPSFVPSSFPLFPPSSFIPPLEETVLPI